MADDAFRRILDLFFLFETTSVPIPTAQIVSDADLGYGGASPDSEKRKFNRDRAALAQAGVYIRDVTPGGASRTEDGLWALDRERTFAERRGLDLWDAAALLDGLNGLLMRPGLPYRHALARVRDRLAALVEGAGGPLPSQATGEPVKTDPKLAAIWAAFSSRTPFRIRYVDAKGAESQRTVSVYGMFAREDTWYFVGLDSSSGAVRTFRADRVARAYAPKGPAYEVPAGFDISDYLLQPFEFGRGEAVRCSFLLPASMPAAEREALTGGRGSRAQTAGGEVWEVDVRDLSAAAALALSRARRGVRPLGPAELLDECDRMIGKAVGADV